MNKLGWRPSLFVESTMTNTKTSSTSVRHLVRTRVEMSWNVTKTWAPKGKVTQSRSDTFMNAERRDSRLTSLSQILFLRDAVSGFTKRGTTFLQDQDFIKLEVNDDQATIRALSKIISKVLLELFGCVIFDWLQSESVFQWPPNLSRTRFL